MNGVAGVFIAAPPRVVDPVAAFCGQANRHSLRSELKVASGRQILRHTRILMRVFREELVLANELWSRVSPWLARLAGCAGRALVVSGFLESERPAVVAALAALGLDVARHQSETQGADAWGALVAVHAAARHESSRSRRVSSKA